MLVVRGRAGLRFGRRVAGRRRRASRRPPRPSHCVRGTGRSSASRGFVAVCGLAGVTDQELRRRTGADFDCFLIDDHAGALRDEIEFLISKPYLEPLRIYRLLRLRRQKRRDRRCRPLAETGEAEPAAFPVPTVAPGNLSNYPGRTFIGVVRRWAGGVVESVDSVAYYVESRAPGW